MMPSISPTVSLISNDSTVSSFSDISVDANLYDCGYMEDTSTESSQEDSNCFINLLKHENGNARKVDACGTIRNNDVADELWLPPEPENVDEDVISSFTNYDDDDEFGDDVTWAKPSSFSCFGDKVGGSLNFNEVKLTAMSNVRNGKFKALVSRLIKSVGVDSSENYGENWVDIATSLSWEAAAFVKPDANEGKAMDPDGYVKVKCIATGLRAQSRLIKGLVFSKHASHKHMATKYKNPRLLLIDGSLDLSSDGLSSFESIKQETDALKSIVEMIEMYHPNVVLVEKSVSRDIQESVHAKGMTLVFDMKLHRLQRVARCVGSPILSTDVLIRRKLMQCDSFHVEKFVEEHNIFTEGGKKPRKTLMFLEGCPSRLGCTIVLMGANSDELKRIKCVVRCAVVMAYHLMMETSFLLDQSAIFSTIGIDKELIMPIALELPIINGFHQNGSQNSFRLESSDSWKHTDSVEDQMHNKDEISVALDSESILVLMSSRNASRGTICERSRFSRIKFYKSFDVPLGRFLHDHLLNQMLHCKKCGETPEVHVYYYAHHNKQLTIQVRHLPSINSLPGETEGKIWMWSRCDQCKFHDETSTSTKRVLISNAARGLSYGKFLELGFSNHSSFTSPSSCGHSFHKDFIHFFGLGPMVAMFKYSPVETHSVSLPPQMMEFNAVGKEFLKIEYENVYAKGISVFLDIEKLLKDIEARYVGVTLDIQGSNKEFSDIVLILEQEKFQFEVDIQNAVNNDNDGDAACKLLTLNRIRLELFLESCIWDQRLHALLSSDLKLIDNDPITSQAQEHLLQEDRSPEQEFSEANIAAENCDIEDNSFSIKEIQIDGFVVAPSSDDRLVTVEDNFPRDTNKDWIWASFTAIKRECIEVLQRGYLPKIESFNSYASESVAKEIITDEGSRMHIPLGTDYIVSDYEDELSSIMACALTLLKDVHPRKEREIDSRSNSLRRIFSFNTCNWYSFDSLNSEDMDSPPANFRHSHSSSFDGLDVLDSLVSNSSSHPEVSMGLRKYPAKRKYSVVCLYASQFRQLRDRCCPSECFYIASLSRCRNWNAEGGKSKSFFAKTLDDRFIIMEIKGTEFDSFMKFATNYFEYMNQCYELGNQTCLAKIFGVYQVTVRTRSGKEARHDLVVMENLSFGRHIDRHYDLKGAPHDRFNDAGNNSGSVLWDQNFVYDMSVSPLYVSRKSKRDLQRAVYNDTIFLTSINVMDYSLLVGVDTQRRELSCGIIDYLRQYTWDKQLENLYKSSVKNHSPTIIPPKEYKKRLREFINSHFLSVPDHWCLQRSSNPCKICGPVLGNGSLHKKSQKRGNLDDDSSHLTSQKQGKRVAGSL